MGGIWIQKMVEQPLKIEQLFINRLFLFTDLLAIYLVLDKR